jgi:hypothetical protein
VQNVRVRPAAADDFAFLATMLGEAAVWRPDKETPTAERVLADPRYAMYLTGWPRQGDYGLVAEHEEPVGAAWYRTFTQAVHGMASSPRMSPNWQSQWSRGVVTRGSVGDSSFTSSKRALLRDSEP